MLATGLVKPRKSTSLGLTAESAVLHASASIANDGAAAVDVCTNFVLADETGKTVASATTKKTTVAAGSSATAQVAITVHEPELWSSPKPYLYNLTATVSTCSSASGSSSSLATETTVLDSLSTSTGFRSLRYDADEGFFLNEQHYKVRGFCKCQCATMMLERYINA